MINIYSPFVISFLLGYLALHLFFRQEDKPDFLLKVFLGIGLGLGISSFITFLSFLLANGYSRSFVIAGHISALFFLIMFFFSRKNSRALLPDIFRADLIRAGSLLILLAAMIPTWLNANHLPMGGWDAWSVWNYKAKFLFLSGAEWREIFAPYLWRSSPHYPLLLPLVNVWGWSFANNPLPLTTLLTAIIFTFAVAGLLYSALFDLTKNHLVILAPLLALLVPFYATMAASQYCDVVLSYYLLAALFCLIKMFAALSLGYTLLAATFLGFLSFTKPEGMVLAFLLTILAVIFIKISRGIPPAKKQKVLLWFILGLAAAGIATAVFQLLLSPGNQTFTNGLFSKENPITKYRLQLIPIFFLVELQSDKWNGVWLLVLAGIALNFRKIFRREIAIVPLALASYLGIVMFYYALNTYFRIEWWLQVTLNRILVSLLPVALLWVFCGLEKNKK